MDIALASVLGGHHAAIDCDLCTLDQQAAVLCYLAHQRQPFSVLRAHPSMYWCRWCLQVDLFSNGVFDFKQSPRIQVGDALPTDGEFLILEEGSNEPKSVTVDQVLKGKKVVLFGLPGEAAMLPTSSHTNSSLASFCVQYTAICLHLWLLT